MSDFHDYDMYEIHRSADVSPIVSPRKLMKSRIWLPKDEWAKQQPWYKLARETVSGMHATYAAHIKAPTVGFDPSETKDYARSATHKDRLRRRRKIDVRKEDVGWARVATVFYRQVALMRGDSSHSSSIWVLMGCGCIHVITRSEVRARLLVTTVGAPPGSRRLKGGLESIAGERMVALRYQSKLKSHITSSVSLRKLATSRAGT